MRAWRDHWRVACLFVLLSAADLVLTWELLRRPGGEHYEANWLAHSVLARFDFAGLAAFKALTVLVVGLLVYLVARSRPTAARRLAAFACLAVGGVVLYSTALLARQASDPVPAAVKGVAVIEQEKRVLDRATRTQGAFSAALARWGGELAAGRCTLAEAVRDLSASEQTGRFAEGVRGPFGSPGTSDVECIAALVTRTAIGQLLDKGPGPGRARAERLLAAYRAEYGSGLLNYLLEEFRNARGAERPGGRASGAASGTPMAHGPGAGE